ncbi:hypothetical protein MRB53_023562 [Persea americana]|uniref:Uncharacterized protein n=1 Tax=Persea americana TaxID=3435 RepID=A0ACC2LB13_PERAE|nr:hypothetical protein MRB53_023562 [Persea americana]
MQFILENPPEAMSGCTRGEEVVCRFSFLVAKNTNGVDVWIYYVQVVYSGKVDMQSILENLPEATSVCTRGEEVVCRLSFLVAKNTNGVDVRIYSVQAVLGGKATIFLPFHSFNMDCLGRPWEWSKSSPLNCPSTSGKGGVCPSKGGCSGP